MTHEKSVLKMTVKDGLVKIKIKEVYKDNADGKLDRKFNAGEYDLNNNNIEEVIVEHAKSWVKGDWINEDAFE